MENVKVCCDLNYGQTNLTLGGLNLEIWVKVIVDIAKTTSQWTRYLYDANHLVVDEIKC